MLGFLRVSDHEGFQGESSVCQAQLVTDMTPPAMKASVGFRSGLKKVQVILPLMPAKQSPTLAPSLL